MASSTSRLCLSALLVILSLVAYWPAYQAEFVDFDDSDYIYANSHVATGLSGENLHWAFTRYHSSNWHPLTWISHMVDVELFGLDAGGHHAVNVALHAANAVLLFLMLGYITGDLAASFVAAALFAIHPINVESVAWVSQRKTTLSTLFGILSIWSYAVYALKQNRRAYFASMALFAASLMAKQTLVTLPFALLLLDYWPLNRKELQPPAKRPQTWDDLLRGWYRLAPEKLPYLALAVLACVVTLLVQQQAMNTVEKLPLETRLGNISIAYVAYLGKLLWPVHLAAFYPLYDQDITPLRVLGSLAGLAAITAACCHFGRRRRYLLTGWLWYLGTMVPVIGLVHVGAQSMADRYAYVSFWGLWIIAVWGTRDLWLLLMQRLLGRNAVAAIVVVLVSVLGWLTFAQAAKWHDTITLFEDAAADTEHNWLAHRVLADHYLNQGDYPRSLKHCEQGLACGKQLHRLLSTQGRALFETGQREQAVEKLKQAVEADPENSLARTNLGWVYGELGQYDAAIDQLSAAAKLLTPADSVYARQILYANWANALAKTNRLSEALEKFDLALAADPANAALARAAGEAALRSGKFDRARDLLLRASSLEPGNPATAILQGQLHAAGGDLTAAEASFEQALALAPNNPTATLRLVDVLLRSHRTSDAVARLLQTHDALAKVDHPSAKMPDSLILTRLADLLAAGGKHAGAIERYEQALAAWQENSRAANNLAWLLATHPKSPPRDGPRALKLAQLASQLVGEADPSTLGTLAAAYAANGQMTEALETAERAQQLAHLAGDQAGAKALDAQIRAYREDQLYLVP